MIIIGSCLRSPLLQTEATAFSSRRNPLMIVLISRRLSEPLLPARQPGLDVFDLDRPSPMC
jgi:hypothetical protein